MLKPVSTNRLIFDGKNENFELFDDLFQTMFKLYSKTTEAMKITTFLHIYEKKLLQALGNASSPYKKAFDNLLIVFRREYVKPESQATATHKW